VFLHDESNSIYRLAVFDGETVVGLDMFFIVSYVSILFLSLAYAIPKTNKPKE